MSIFIVIGLKLKILKINTLSILNNIFDLCYVDVVEFRNYTSTNLPMFHPQLNFLCGGKNQLIEIVDDELQRLRTTLINLNDLRDDGSIEGFILHLLEKREQLFYFFLHLCFVCI